MRFFDNKDVEFGVLRDRSTFYGALMRCIHGVGRKKSRKPHTLKVGDILTDGGHVVVDVSFYEVVAVSREAVTICEIAKTIEADGAFHEWVTPRPNQFSGDPLIVLAYYEDGNNCVTGNRKLLLYVWKGKQIMQVSRNID